MENSFFYLTWSVLGPFMALIVCLGIFLYLVSKKLNKDTRLIDYFTNILIILGAVAWVVITS